MNRSCSTSSDVNIDPNGAPDRHVQLVDLALAVDVLEAPHPSLAGRIDVSVWSGARTMWKKTTEAQTKMPIEMTNGINDHPSSSGTEPVIGAPTLSPGVVAVLDREVDDAHHDDDREERRDRDDAEIEVVDLGGERGGLRRGRAGIQNNIRALRVALHGRVRLLPPHQER